MVKGNGLVTKKDLDETLIGFSKSILNGVQRMFDIHEKRFDGVDKRFEGKEKNLKG